MSRQLFITATDTGAGKTYVTAALARLLLDRGEDCLALKPIASGLDADGRNEDIEALLSAQNARDIDALNLYRLHMPAAPAVSAKAEGLKIDADRLVTWCERRAAAHTYTLIEGVGGLMVPLAEDFLVQDWLGAMPEADVVLVVGARLGAMNHTLLTLAELNRMQRPPAWIIFNALADDGMAGECRNAIHAWLPASCRCLELPYAADPEPALSLLLSSLSDT